MRSDPLLYAAGTIGLGLVGLWFGDFALQWQPVPKSVPGRDGLALLSGALLVLGGAACALPRWSARGALALALFYGAWVVALHGMRIAAAPLDLVAWLGAAEIGALAAGGLMLAADGDTARRTAQLIFGLSALVFGVSHFVYADFTARMIPAWVPARPFWAWATGVGHCLAGLAIVSGTAARLAAAAMAAMCLSFALILHVPAVVARPGSHAAWTMLFVTVAIAGAAWSMRRATRLV